ncbi:snRNP Sm protein [Cystobasidiomycetes sp. EMM_F5]
MSSLTGYIDKQVLVVTQDGRVIVGELKGFDQTTNIILSGSSERIFSIDEPVEEVPLGIYLIRGDNMRVDAVTLRSSQYADSLSVLPPAPS